MKILIFKLIFSVECLVRTVNKSDWKIEQLITERRVGKYRNSGETHRERWPERPYPFRMGDWRSIWIGIEIHLRRLTRSMQMS